MESIIFLREEKKSLFLSSCRCS